MKTKKADIRITFKGDQDKEAVDVAAVLEGEAMSVFDRDVETVTVLLMGVASVLGDMPLLREEFLELCGKAYDMNLTNEARHSRVEIPIDKFLN